jgi:mono/diheme cytochrome c family protein
MRPARSFITISAGAALLLGAGVLIYQKSARSDRPFPGNRAENGQKIYAASCAVCHGVNLEGQANWRIIGEDGILPAPPHNEEGHTWHHGDGLLFDYTKLGGAAALELRGVTGFKSGMPAFSDSLTDDEIRDIWAYIKSTWSPQAQAMQKSQTDSEQLE